jgi:hypothetical protein
MKSETNSDYSQQNKEKSSIIGAPRTEGEAAGLQLSAPNAKKNCRYDDINGFT